MKKFILLFLLLPAVNAGAQYSRSLYFQLKLPPAYDTSYTTAEQRKVLADFEYFRTMMFALPEAISPDTSIRYRLRYSGTCFSSWPQTYLHNQEINKELTACRCVLDTVKEKIYTLSQLRKLNPLGASALIIGYGNRYVWVRGIPVIHEGNATTFSNQTEFYLERIE